MDSRPVQFRTGPEQALQALADSVFVEFNGGLSLKGLLSTYFKFSKTSQIEAGPCPCCMLLALFISAHASHFEPSLRQDVVGGQIYQVGWAATPSHSLSISGAAESDPILNLYSTWLILLNQLHIDFAHGTFSAFTYPVAPEVQVRHWYCRVTDLANQLDGASPPHFARAV